MFFTHFLNFTKYTPNLPIIRNSVEFFATKRAGNIFADPTYDNTFKMLCTSKKHPEIIKSILNSFLDLEGKEQIDHVSFSQRDKINVNKNDTAYMESTSLENTTRYAVDSTIDLLCTSQNGKKIAIEMQRAHEDYFLARSQMYMSKLIASQVGIGESAKAHEVILDTYIICIGRANMIREASVLKQQKEFAKESSDLSYSLTVTPTIHDFGITVEDNKMTWKFFELNKFKDFMKYTKIDLNSPTKHQWMKFLIKCQDEENTPEDVAEIIKEGYKIMQMANWTQEERVLYDMEIDQEKLTACKIKKAKADGLAKGRVEGEAKGIKKALKNGENNEEILSEYDSLNKVKLTQIKNLISPPKLDDIIEILVSNDLSSPEQTIEVAGNITESDSNDFE